MSEYERIQMEIEKIIDDYLYKLRLQSVDSNIFFDEQIEDDIPWYLRDLPNDNGLDDRGYSKHL